MTIEFLGNKRQLLHFIDEHIQTDTQGAPRKILDVFSGTGAVSAFFKEQGYEVIANDFLYFCTVFSKANLFVHEDPPFAGVMPYIDNRSKRAGDSPYDNVLHYLNGLPGHEGFMYHHYSPASARRDEVQRMYFTEKNAAKIDGIRATIRHWSPYLTEGEMAILIMDLLIATSQVSNIAGTYGCYMKYWKKKALNELKLTPSRRIPNVVEGSVHSVTNEDANELVKKVSCPIIYADPPYTKRQYSAYYHLLETIAIGDEPAITGSTGLRPWEEKSSDYCYRRKAPKALDNLVKDSHCEFFILSYNNDGQIEHEQILAILSKYGHVQCHEMLYKRYKSNHVSRKENPLIERLYVLNKREK